ncbi:MAG: hypothetical protein RL684_3294 [Pseudomonadota bacterium]|jgi:hypothetical protein
MRDADGATWATGRSGRWVLRFPIDVLRSLRQRVTAYDTTRNCLRLHREVQRDLPHLSGSLLYQEVVRRYTGLDDKGSLEILARAEVSYANWPVERDLRFQDVVQYLAAQRCIDGRPADEGISISLSRIISQQVPATL